MCRQRMAGYTIIEILVVIAIVTILASIVLPVFVNMKRNARYNTCMENLREISVALALYHSEFDRYPNAPHPDYLKSMDLTAMPLEDFPQGQTGDDLLQSTPLREWQLVTTKFAADVAADKNDITVTVVAGAAQITDGMILLLHGNNHSEFAVVDSVTVIDAEKSKILLTEKLKYAYAKDDAIEGEFIPDGAVTSAAKVTVGNFGLATLYQLYLKDEKNYLRSYQRFHCPELRRTDNVDRGSILESVTPQYADYRTFDPLWAGYNTYDVTYNFNQYYNGIREFDNTLGYGDVNSKRQLLNPDPPADSVVCWCYGHTRSQQAATQAVEMANGVINEVGRRKAERLRRLDVSLVLWVDGTVVPVRPYLKMKKQEDPDDPKEYYWVPPYLYSPGEWNK